jgi:hypothetical protein
MGAMGIIGGLTVTTIGLDDTVAASVAATSEGGTAVTAPKVARFADGVESVAILLVASPPTGADEQPPMNRPITINVSSFFIFLLFAWQGGRSHVDMTPLPAKVPVQVLI